jgi:hypothetical protein
MMVPNIAVEFATITANAKQLSKNNERLGLGSATRGGITKTTSKQAPYNDNSSLETNEHKS